MTMSMIGRNTVSGEQLLGFVERFEVLKSQKDEIGADQTLLMAEAKNAGFVPAGIRLMVKLRALKPAERQEAEALRDMYLHALGMDADLPLFRQVGLMGVDVASRESVIEAMKAFVPENGSITVEAGGRPVRLTRDKSGVVSAAEVNPPALDVERKPAATPARARREVPEVDDAGALELGREAYRQNAPIITNPFPFGDGRRARWDEGWRKESGTDGMGPNG